MALLLQTIGVIPSIRTSWMNKATREAYILRVSGYQQIAALKTLHERGAIPMSELAGSLRCDTSNVTGIVDRLEQRGLVERRNDASDRRVRLLELTERGAELGREVGRRMRRPPAELTRLSVADQRALRDILRRGFAE